MSPIPLGLLSFPSGAAGASFAFEGSGGRPYSGAIDTQGNFYYTNLGELFKFDPNGTLVKQIALSGVPNQWYARVFVNPHDDSVWVNTRRFNNALTSYQDYTLSSSYQIFVEALHFNANGDWYYAGQQRLASNGLREGCWGKVLANGTVDYANEIGNGVSGSVGFSQATVCGAIMEQPDGRVAVASRQRYNSSTFLGTIHIHSNGNSSPSLKLTTTDNFSDIDSGRSVGFYLQDGKKFLNLVHNDLSDPTTYYMDENDVSNYGVYAANLLKGADGGYVIAETRDTGTYSQIRLGNYDSALNEISTSRFYPMTDDRPSYIVAASNGAGRFGLAQNNSNSSKTVGVVTSEGNTPSGTVVLTDSSPTATQVTYGAIPVGTVTTSGLSVGYYTGPTTTLTIGSVTATTDSTETVITGVYD